MVKKLYNIGQKVLNNFRIFFPVKFIGDHTPSQAGWTL